MVPAPALVERFRTDFEALAGAPPERLGIAVSGGPDSLALLLLAAAAYPGRVRAATVDHGLRAESAREAEFVDRICASLAVPHATLRVGIEAESSLQQAARHARYRALADWLAQGSIPWLATAHHLDDQAETLLMRLLRGSGVGGLAGVRRTGPVPAPGSRAVLLRPLLGWRRSELAAILAGAALQPVADPSNLDERFDRARIRRLLGETGWIDPVPLARSAEALAEAEEGLAWAAAQLGKERVCSEGDGIFLEPGGLPPELLRRIVRSILAEIAPADRPLRGEALTRFIAALREGRSATLAGVKGIGGARWRFEPAPQRR